MNIRELFDKKKCVFSFEMFPPKKESADMGAMLDTVNGLKKLSELCTEQLGISCRFGGRVARKGEIEAEADRITDEELARIHFPVDIED